MKLPAEGVDQFTAVLVLPVTVAVNFCVWLAVKVTLVGAIVIPTVGESVMVAVADLVGSAVLVAVRETFCVDVIDAGAV